jgi:hypothetical protein
MLFKLIYFDNFLNYKFKIKLKKFVKKMRIYENINSFYIYF